MNNTFDFVIVGAGIVGAATALTLQQQFPSKRILLLEKESQPALHQTGRNSGVVHAGVYYQPGSLKAKYCRQGMLETKHFCQENKLAYDECGKLLVACDEVEMQRMNALFERCEQNGLEPQLLNQQQLNQREPNVTGLGAIFIQQTAITDYTAITTKMLELFVRGGGEVRFNNKVSRIIQNGCNVQVYVGEKPVDAGFLLNCSGLMSDRLIESMELNCDFRIIPFRGEYFQLPTTYNNMFQHLIYPIPDPSMPFLGVHLTKMIDGSVTVGPNAVLALATEGYNKTDIHLADLWRILGYAGSWKVFWQHRKSGVMELKNSWFKSAYLKRVHKYCANVSLGELKSYPSGVRAQAVSRDGKLIHDFKFVESGLSLHVGNAPSPAATSAIPIARHIVRKVMDKLD